MTTYIFNDDVRSTLLDSIDASVTTINVTNPVGIYNDPPSPGVGEIATLKIVDRLDNPSRKEIITYIGRSTVTGGYALTGVVRGSGGTTAALWESGCFVVGLVSADYLATLAASADIPTTTDDLPEGTSNLYFTETRVVNSPVGTATQTALDLKLDVIDANKHLTIIDETGGVIVVNTENNSLPIVDETGATLFVDLVVSDQETVHTFTTYTASHTLTLADASTISNSSPIVEMNVATANTLTVPPNNSVEFVIGSKIDVVQIGAGQTTITPGSGVTIYGTPGLKFRAQESGVTLIKRAVNTWRALGDLSA